MASAGETTAPCRDDAEPPLLTASDPPDGAANLPCTAILGLLVALPTAAWAQHVLSCIASGSWGFLIGGTLFLPAGLIHGVGRWLGLWG